MNLAETSDGKLTYGEAHTTNELCNDSKVTDPPAYRLGSPSGEALGKLSGDRLSGGSRKEKTLIIFKEGEEGGGGYYEFFAQRQGTEDDLNMVRLLTLSHKGAFFHVPVSAPGLTSGGASDPPSFMRSADGRFEIHIQGDGNFVVYDTKNLAGWKAWWSWMTGRLR